MPRKNIRKRKIKQGQIQKFRLCCGFVAMQSSPLPVSFIPQQGALILDSWGAQSLLVRSLGLGGQGSVYLTDKAQVCKLYDDSHRTMDVCQKLQLMLTRPLQYPGVCWPRSLAFNQNREFVGFLMDKAKGKELQKVIFLRSALVSTFPNWTRIQLVTLTINILKAISFLHAGNVILGDINPLNILVVDENHVYIIDTDSFQIEGFPCPVGTPSFLTPELAGKNLRGILRTYDQEYFAVTTLVFMLVMLGKAPYSHKGGSDPSKNVRDGIFPYSRPGRNGSNGVPEGDCDSMWNNLPYHLKEKFHQAFTDGNRFPTHEWITVMERYRSDLVRGYVSNDLFPAIRKTPHRVETPTWPIPQPVTQRYIVVSAPPPVVNGLPWIRAPTIVSRVRTLVSQVF